MLRIIYSFSKRIRNRADIKIQPRLKQYQDQFAIRRQGTKLRLNYNKQTTQADFQPFSDILTGDKPKLQQQTTFKLNKVELRKKIKEKYFASIDNIEKEHTETVTGHRDFLENKSHLHDQTQEIEFQQRFRKELFEKKETRLRVRKEVERPENYLTQSINHDVIEYLQAKKEIKNIKTEQMLGVGRSNKVLERIIESGLLDNPAQLRVEIEAYERNASGGEEYEEGDSEYVLQIGEGSNQSDYPLIEPTPSETGLVQYSGILQQVRHQTNQQKNKVIKTLDLMQKVKEFQHRQFLKRYDAINFRFKGKVGFDCYTQPQLLSYIKHQNIEPQELLQIFSQNLGQTNRDKNSLIMTPAVLTQIYTKTSTFKFPETKENNRTNMLADKSYAKLQYEVFTNLDKLSDRGLTDAIHSFSNNHKEEQGALRPKHFDKIVEVILKEFEDRVGYLEEMLLGAVCRSLINLPVTQNSKDTEGILSKIMDRITGVKDLYALESVCMFCSLIDSSKAKQILGQAIDNFYYSSDWNMYTLVNTTKFFSSLLLASPEQIQLYQPKLLELYQGMADEIPAIIPQVNINNLQGVAVFFLKLGFYEPTVWNSIKKQASDSLKQQKSMLNANTVPTLVSTFAFFDYHYKYNCKNIQEHSILNQFLVRRALRHNSSKFAFYHEAAKFLSDEANSTPLKGKLMILKSLAFNKYQNKPFFDTYINEIMRSVLEKGNNVGVLMELVHCHSLLRRANSMTDYMISKIRSQNVDAENIRIQVLISYLSSLGNLCIPTEQLKEHAEKVFNRIHSYLWDITNSQRISILCSLTQLGLYDSLIAQDVLRSIENKQMSGEEQYLLSMCLQFPKIVPKKWSSLKARFTQLELEYYQKTKEDVLENQFSIGAMFPFQKFQSDFVKRQSTSDQKVVSLPWRVEIHGKQLPEVYFFYTYDMLAERESDTGEVTEMFPTGIWKLYVDLYRTKKYQVEVLKTFQFKRTFDAVDT